MQINYAKQNWNFLNNKIEDGINCYTFQVIGEKKE